MCYSFCQIVRTVHLASYVNMSVIVMATPAILTRVYVRVVNVIGDIWRQIVQKVGDISQLFPSMLAWLLRNKRSVFTIVSNKYLVSLIVFL